ncbi:MULTISPECIES: hypothetical protein [unclassified Caballeronia]|uniref:hypothetical protein n=1 Tax=unclassified Caballeronia TaxID=2646786 RepID=UPI0028657E4C|nr:MULTISPECIES: hypothetical protein [unclassified Caballeronia]MDR5740621.1 hypothetical protein [Caballeronia sp. LZ016]MDR5808856.1 hypothetical protein [Caballeronia sp. LZ019]
MEENTIMGLGLQIAYRGFAGSHAGECAAEMELVRLEVMASDIVDCHLAVEAYRDRAGSRVFDARLDLITRGYDLLPVERGTNAELGAAIHSAFDNAVRLLQQRRVPSPAR